VFNAEKDSMNALILKTLGRFPKTREVIKFPNAQILVMSISGDMVQRVKVIIKKGL